MAAPVLPPDPPCLGLRLHQGLLTCTATSKDQI
uniref:Uncharacterized protein n=1 Tax=Arundo donax TaxID=35708 RepID=A0A0A9AV44_ARUDO